MTDTTIRIKEEDMKVIWELKGYMTTALKKKISLSTVVGSACRYEVADIKRTNRVWLEGKYRK